MDLPRAVDTQVRLVGDLDVLDQLGVPHRPCRRRSCPCGVVGARSDLHPSVPKDLADRLDSELLALNEAVAMGIDVVDDHRDRNLAGYLILRSSSAAAKNAADVLKISFARRSSRTSRSSSANLCASSVVVPGRTPPSTSL